MGLAGLFLGLKGQDTVTDVWWTALSSIWAATMGYGIGSIFDQRIPTKWVVIYWMATMAVVGPLFAVVIEDVINPFSSNTRQIAAGATGVLVGAFLGMIFGNIHTKRLRRKLQTSSGVAEL